MIRKFTNIKRKLPYTLKTEILPMLNLAHWVTRWFCSANLSTLIDLAMGSLTISVCVWKATHTQEVIYIFIMSVKIISLNCHLQTFSDLSVSVTNIWMTHIIENNNKSKQFARLDNWEIAPRPSVKFLLKYHVSLGLYSNRCYRGVHKMNRVSYLDKKSCGNLRKKNRSWKKLELEWTITDKSLEREGKNWKRNGWSSSSLNVHDLHWLTLNCWRMRL